MKRVVGPGPGAVTGEDRIPRGGKGHIRQGGQSQGLAWEAPEVRATGAQSGLQAFVATTRGHWP